MCGARGKVKVSTGAGVGEQPGLRGLCVAGLAAVWGARDDVDDGVRADGDAHGLRAESGFEADCGLRDLRGRRSWEGLAGNLRESAGGCGEGQSDEKSADREHVLF